MYFTNYFLALSAVTAHASALPSNPGELDRRVFIGFRKAVNTPITPVGDAADYDKVRFKPQTPITASTTLAQMLQYQRMWDIQKDAMVLAQFMQDMFKKHPDTFSSVMHNWFPAGEMTAQTVANVYGKIVDGGFFNNRKASAACLLNFGGDCVRGEPYQETMLEKIQLLATPDQKNCDVGADMYLNNPPTGSWKNDLRGSVTYRAQIAACPIAWKMRNMTEILNQVKCEGFGDVISTKMQGFTTTMLHELTHYDYVGAEGLALTRPNDDWRVIDVDVPDPQQEGEVNGCYGPVMAHGIAGTDKAFQNADNYMYFAVQLYWQDKCGKTFRVPTGDEDACDAGNNGMPEEARRALHDYLVAEVKAKYPRYEKVNLPFTPASVI